MWLPLFCVARSNPCWIIQNPFAGFVVEGCSFTGGGALEDVMRWFRNSGGSSEVLNKHPGDWQRWISPDSHWLTLKHCWQAGVQAGGLQSQSLIRYCHADGFICSSVPMSPISLLSNVYFSHLSSSGASRYLPVCVSFSVQQLPVIGLLPSLSN